MKKIITLVIVVAVIALAAIKLLSTKKEVANQPTPLALNYSIQTTNVVEGEVLQKRPFLAKLESDKEIKVATKLSGVITKLFVSESQSVKKGDLLVSIDDKAIKSNLNTLKETLKVQKSDVEYYASVLKRNKKLYQANAISKEKYDASKLQLLGKQAALKATKDKISSLKVDLTYLQVRAPFDGVVSGIFLHKGDLATFSKPILALSAHAQKMQFSYASTNKKISIGQRVLQNNQEIGKISKIYPNAQNNLNVAEVALSKKIQQTNDSYLSVEVVTNSARGCTLPLNALLHEKGATFILAYNKTKFHKRAVDIVVEGDERVIISPCVNEKIALASESKLSILPFYENLTVVGVNDAK
ncbi:efflux RND transporter periplasmic adaptor subunit [Sulfurimonas sp.]